jgi:hypothetical protein
MGLTGYTTVGQGKASAMVVNITFPENIDYNGKTYRVQVQQNLKGMNWSTANKQNSAVAAEMFNNAIYRNGRIGDELQDVAIIPGEGNRVYIVMSMTDWSRAERAFGPYSNDALKDAVKSKISYIMGSIFGFMLKHEKVVGSLKEYMEDRFENDMEDAAKFSFPLTPLEQELDNQQDKIKEHAKSKANGANKLQSKSDSSSKPVIEGAKIRQSLREGPYWTLAKMASEYIEWQDTSVFDFSTLNQIGGSFFGIEGLVKGKDIDVAKIPQQPERNSAMLMLVADAITDPFWPEGLGFTRGYLSILENLFMLKLHDQCMPLAQERGEQYVKDLNQYMKNLTEKTLAGIKTPAQTLERAGDSSNDWSILPSKKKWNTNAKIPAAPKTVIELIRAAGVQNFTA